MFEKYLIVDDSLRNEISGDTVSGFSVNARIGYYRGLGLSMVDVSLEVDGVVTRRRDITFTVHGSSYSLDALENVFDDRWGYTEEATITVAQPGGLTAGTHSVTLTERLRVSYAAATNETRVTKWLTVS